VSRTRTPVYGDVPDDVLRRLRAIAAALPETYEEQAWTGRRWMIRRRNFAHVFTIENEAGSTTIVMFRSSGFELDALAAAGHPFFRAGWGTNGIGMVLDDTTDWEEVRELLTESFCLLAPKKIAALVERPGDDGA
jgi:hypothetical protein